MKRRHTAAVVEHRIAGLKVVRAALELQIAFLEDLHEDLVLGTKDG